MAAMSFAAAPAPVGYAMKRAGPMANMAPQMDSAVAMEMSAESDAMDGAVLAEEAEEAAVDEYDQEVGGEVFFSGEAFEEEAAPVAQQKVELPTGYLVKTASIRGTWKLSQELLGRLQLAQSVSELKQLTKIKDEEQLATVLAAAFLLKNSKDSRSAQILLEKSKAFLESKRVKWSVVEGLSKSLFV